MGPHSSRSRSRSPKRQRRDRAASGSPRGRSRSPAGKRRFSSRSTSRSRSPPGTYASRLNGYSPTRGVMYGGRFGPAGTMMGAGRVVIGLGGGAGGNGGCAPPPWVTNARLAPQVKMVLEGLYRGGKLGPTDLEYACVEFLELLGPVGGMAVLEEFATLDYFRIRNLTAFFIGICKRVQARAPPPPGRPLRGPDGGSPPPGGGLRGRTLSRGVAVGVGGGSAVGGPAGGLSTRVVSHSPGAGPGMRRASPPLHFMLEDGSPPPRRWVSKSPPPRRWVSKSPPPRRFESKSPPRRRWVSRSPPPRRFGSKSPLPRRWVSRSPPLRRAGSRSPIQRRWMSRSPPLRRGTSKSPQRRSRRVSEQDNSGSQSHSQSLSPPTSHQPPPPPLPPPPPPPPQPPSPPPQQQQQQQGQREKQASVSEAPAAAVPTVSANTMSTNSRTSASGDRAGGGGEGNGALQGDRVADSASAPAVAAQAPVPPPPPAAPGVLTEAIRAPGSNDHMDAVATAGPPASGVEGDGARAASCGAVDGLSGPLEAGVVNSTGCSGGIERNSAAPERLPEASPAEHLSPAQQQYQQRLRRQQIWQQQQQLQQQQEQQGQMSDVRQALPEPPQSEALGRRAVAVPMSAVLHARPAPLSSPVAAAPGSGSGTASRPVSPSSLHGHVQHGHGGSRSHHGHQQTHAETRGDDRAGRFGAAIITTTSMVIAATAPTAPMAVSAAGPAPASSGTSGSGIGDQDARVADGPGAAYNGTVNLRGRGSSTTSAPLGTTSADVVKASGFGFGSGSDDGSGDTEVLFEPAALLDTRLIAAIATALQTAAATALTGSASGGMYGAGGGGTAAAVVLAAGSAYVLDPPVPVGAYPLGGWLGLEVATEAPGGSCSRNMGSAASGKPRLPEPNKVSQALEAKGQLANVKQEERAADAAMDIPSSAPDTSAADAEKQQIGRVDSSSGGVGGSHSDGFGGWNLGGILTQALAAVAGGGGSGCEGGVLRQAVTEHVKEALKPAWRANKLTRETFKAVAKKAVDRVLGTLPNNGVGSLYDNPAGVATFFSDARREAIGRVVEALLLRLPTGNMVAAMVAAATSTAFPAASAVMVAAGGGVTSSTDCAVERSAL